MKSPRKRCGRGRKPIPRPLPRLSAGLLWHLRSAIQRMEKRGNPKDKKRLLLHNEMLARIEKYLYRPPPNLRDARKEVEEITTKLGSWPFRFQFDGGEFGT